MRKLKVALPGGTTTVPSFTLLAKQTDDIITNVVETLYDLDADPYEIIGTRAQPVAWDYPSRWSEKYAAEGLVMAAAATVLLRPGDTARAIKAAQHVVRREGKVSEQLIKDMRHYIGPAANVHAFYMQPHPNAEAYFAIDMACLLWNVASYTVKSETMFGVRLRRDMRHPLIGVTNEDIVWQELSDYLEAPRGYVEFKELDLIDRIHTWVMQRLPDIDLDTFIRRLAMLKLQASPKVVYRLEQALLNYAPPTFDDPSLAQLMFTDENLEAIRDTWFTNKEAKERYRDLYDAMVPTFIDDSQFVEMFVYQIGRAHV